MASIMEHLGPPMWGTMHGLAYMFPDTPSAEERLHAWRFYSSLCDAIPCGTCREHYSKMFNETIPYRGDTREDLTRWVVDVHNAVNRRLGRPEISYEEAAARHQTLLSGKCSVEPAKTHYGRQGAVIAALCAAIVLLLLAGVVYLAARGGAGCKAAHASRPYPAGNNYYHYY